MPTTLKFKAEFQLYMQEKLFGEPRIKEVVEIWNTR